MVISGVVVIDCRFIHQMIGRQILDYDTIWRSRMCNMNRIAASFDMKIAYMCVTFDKSTKLWPSPKISRRVAYISASLIATDVTIDRHYANFMNSCMRTYIKRK